jgi:hypothetical protein
MQGTTQENIYIIYKTEEDRSYCIKKENCDTANI